MKLQKHNRISVQEAAKIMGVTCGFVYVGLRKGKFPFGSAIRHESGRWTYWIGRKRFFDYLGIPDPKEKEVSTSNEK